MKTFLTGCVVLFNNLSIPWRFYACSLQLFARVRRRHRVQAWCHHPACEWGNGRCLREASEAGEANHQGEDEWSREVVPEEGSPGEQESYDTDRACVSVSIVEKGRLSVVQLEYAPRRYARGALCFFTTLTFSVKYVSIPGRKLSFTHLLKEVIYVRW